MIVEERVNIIAHHGDQTVAQPNTMVAFDSAVSLGATALGVDVRSTYDNYLVVTEHPVWNDKLSDLKQAILLEQLLERYGEQIAVNLELIPEERNISRIIGTIRDYRRYDITMASSSLNMLAYVKFAMPYVPLEIISRELNHEIVDLTIAKEHGFAAIRVSECAMSTPFVELAHSYGVKVNIHTIDYRVHMETAVKFGIDGIVTNYIGRMGECDG